MRLKKIIGILLVGLCLGVSLFANAKPATTTTAPEKSPEVQMVEQFRTFQQLLTDKDVINLNKMIDPVMFLHQENSQLIGDSNEDYCNRFLRPDEQGRYLDEHAITDEALLMCRDNIVENLSWSLLQVEITDANEMPKTVFIYDGESPKNLPDRDHRSL